MLFVGIYHKHNILKTKIMHLYNITRDTAQPIGTLLHSAVCSYGIMHKNNTDV